MPPHASHSRIGIRTKRTVGRGLRHTIPMEGGRARRRVRPLRRFDLSLSVGCELKSTTSRSVLLNQSDYPPQPALPANESTMAYFDANDSDASDRMRSMF